MSKTAGTILALAAAGAGFALGVCVGKANKQGQLPPQPSQGFTPRKFSSSRSDPGLPAGLPRFRSALAEREERVRELEAELEEVRKRIPLPPTPEGEQERRRRDRQKACREKSQELRERILQREDWSLRAEALSELTALFHSQDTEKLLVGLYTVPAIQHINCDREAYKPYLFACLSHQDSEVRQAAIWPAYAMCSRDEQLEILLSIVHDPSVDVRRTIANREGWLIKDDEKEKVFSAFRVLLEDEDWGIKKRALDTLGRWPELSREMEELAIELSSDPRYTDEMMRWLARRPMTSADFAGRPLQTMEQAGQLTDRSASDEGKSILLRHCLETLRDNLDHHTRTLALFTLRRLGDVSVLPELEKISLGPDAEGIERQLAETIEYIKQKGDGQR
jgi:hypothetical protein